MPATRSIACSIAAACSAGNASSSRNAVMNCAQTKNGRRNQVRPGARSCTMVVMKFIEPSSDEKMMKQHAREPQRLAVAERQVGERRVGRPAGVRRAAGRRRSWRA